MRSETHQKTDRKRLNFVFHKLPKQIAETFSVDVKDYRVSVLALLPDL